jgi:hypothetical protein
MPRPWPDGHVVIASKGNYVYVTKPHDMRSQRFGERHTGEHLIVIPHMHPYAGYASKLLFTFHLWKHRTMLREANLVIEQ